MILPQLQEALVVASDQMVARRRRRTQRFRLGLLTSAAVVSLGGGAVASQPLWAPLLGWEDGNRATVSRDAVPAAQTAALGLLRRPQEAADRGPAARSALSWLSSRYVGVKLEGIRVVPAPDGTSSVVVPVATVRGRTAGARTATSADAVCLQIALRDPTADDGGRQCYSTVAIHSGEAVLVAGQTVRGLVPDGVSRVRFHAPGGRAYDTAVRQNVFVAPLAALAGTDHVSWLNPAGTARQFANGTTTRAMTLPVVAVPTPVGMHDCGRSRGGVVPKRISCGAQAKRYRPALGAPQAPSQKP